MGLTFPSEPLANWAFASPHRAGLNPGMAERLTALVHRGEFKGLHALLLVRNGIPGLECYFAGPDEHYGMPLGVVQHGAHVLHDLRSVTKTMVNLLYGIALADGMVPPVTEKLFNCYPAHLDDRAKAKITIGHVLSMRTGLAWTEGLDYDNPANSERLMEAAPDRIAYVLGQPLVGKPGELWNYSGGCTALLGDLIARGTGMDLAHFADLRLFRPLGIERTGWMRAQQEVPVASSGLRMLPRDVARIGQMILNKGYWNGARIVPSDWLVKSHRPRAATGDGLHYGYQWWIGRLAATGKPWMAAFGNGGQRLIIVPSRKLVVVIMAGNYNAPDQWKMPAQLMQKIVMPGLTAG